MALEFVTIHHHLKASKHKRTTSTESKGLLLILKLLSEILQNTKEQLICSLLNTTKLQMLSTSCHVETKCSTNHLVTKLAGFHYVVVILCSLL